MADLLRELHFAGLQNVKSPRSPQAGLISVIVITSKLFEHLEQVNATSSPIINQACTPLLDRADR